MLQILIAAILLSTSASSSHPLNAQRDVRQAAARGPNGELIIYVRPVYLAVALFMYGRQDQALLLLTTDIREDPGNALAYAIRGQVHFYTRHWDEAIADFSASIRLDPQRSAVYVARGKLRCGKHNYDQGIADYNTAILLDPCNYEAWQARAEAYLFWDVPGKAVADATRAMRLNPRNVWVYLARAQGYSKTGCQSLAKKDLTTAQAVDPGCPETFLVWATVAYWAGDIDGMIWASDQAVRLRPDNAMAYAIRSMAYLGKGEFRKSFADYCKGSQLNPKAIRIDVRRDRATGRVDVRLDLSPPHGSADAPETATNVKECSELIQSNRSDVAALHKRVVAYAHQNDAERTIADCSEIFRLDRHDTEAFRVRATCLAHLNRHEEAIADCTQALEEDRENPVILALRGQAHALNGNHAGAIKDTAAAIHLGMKEARVFDVRGWVYQLDNDYEMAAAEFSQALRIDPNDGQAHGNLARVYAVRGKHKESVAEYSEALRLIPQAADIHLARGYQYHQMSEFTKAAEDFTAAIKLDPKNAGARTGLAVLRATCPDANMRDGASAVQYATEACKLTHWKDVSSLSVLAAAYAECGQFDKAIQWQKEAIAHCTPAQKGRLDAGVARYQERQPPHE
jgi:tetratricopeptide (TPR) repeat protein